MIKSFIYLVAIIVSVISMNPANAMFSENRDSLNTGHEFASPGPREGFLESFATAYDAGVKGTKTSIYYRMADAYNNQNRTLREIGEQNVPKLNVAEPGRIASYYSTEDEQPRFNVSDVEEYDKKINDLRLKYPNANLLTTRDWWAAVQEEQASSAKKNLEQPRKLVGHVGAFIGSTAAILNPIYNPINLLLLIIGTWILFAYCRTIFSNLIFGFAVFISLALPRSYTGKKLLMKSLHENGFDILQIPDEFLTDCILFAERSTAFLKLKGKSRLAINGQFGRCLITLPDIMKAWANNTNDSMFATSGGRTSTYENIFKKYNISEWLLPPHYTSQ